MKEIASRGFFCTNLRSSEPATPLRDRGARNPLTLGLTGPRLLLRPCHPVSEEKGGACLFTPEEVAQTKMSRASDWDSLSLPHCGSRPRPDGLRARLACRARDSGSAERRPSLGYLAPPGVCFANCSRRRRWSSCLPWFYRPNHRKPSSVLGKVHVWTRCCSACVFTSSSPPPTPTPASSVSKVASSLSKEGKGFSLG